MKYIAIFLWFFISITPVYVFSAQEEKDLVEEKPATDTPINQSNESEKTTNKDESEQQDSKKVIEIPSPIEIEQQHKNDINHYLPAKDITPLLVGPDDFITLIQTEMTRNNKGVAILLPDWHQAVTNPKSLNFLRKTLPSQGWTTIAIQPPSKPENYPSIAIKEVEQKEENQKTLEQYKIKLTGMMTEVMEKAKDFPGIFIVISEGNNAAMLVDLYSKKSIDKPSALIVLSSFMPTQDANKIFAENLAKTEFPVLDVYLTKDHPLTKENAELRAALAEKSMKTFYRQRQLNNFIPGYYPEQALLTEINGWLKTVGW